jgi:hypothetical protein
MIVMAVAVDTKEDEEADDDEEKGIAFRVHFQSRFRPLFSRSPTIGGGPPRQW